MIKVNDRRESDFEFDWSEMKTTDETNLLDYIESWRTKFLIKFFNKNQENFSIVHKYLRHKPTLYRFFYD